MGLDITAYRNLRKADEVILDEFGDLADYETQWKPGGSMEWSESVWPGKGAPLEADTVYEWEESFDFRAGSYSGYNCWRDELQRFKGNEAFQELIDFADCEGVIGSILAAKLLEDFKSHYQEAIEYSKMVHEAYPDWFIDSYRRWMKAFEMAADGGAVDFH